MGDTPADPTFDGAFVAFWATFIYLGWFRVHVGQPVPSHSKYACHLSSFLLGVCSLAPLVRLNNEYAPVRLNNEYVPVCLNNEYAPVCLN